jgi:succinyl-CoA synthetase beta subunit
MKLLEYEAKNIFREFGIPVPAGVVVRSAEELSDLPGLGEELAFKAQLEVGGRGKAGGILFGSRGDAPAITRDLLSRTIRGFPVERVLVEDRLSITQEYYLSVMADRSSREILILFALSGGVDIETLAKERPDAVRKVYVPPLLSEVPSFALRSLLKGAPREIAPVVQKLYRVFREKDALLAEINPLAATPSGIIAADAKLIIDDNSLSRQGITQNRDLTPRERLAEKHGFSYVELEGSIGVIGNGAGLTMATLDLIATYGGRAANFLDVGGGADQERVTEAVRLVAGMPSVQVILVNLLGGITRCDDVARGIIGAGVPQTVVVRMAGTNEEEGRAILREHGYEMYETMEEAVKAAVEGSR